MDNLRTIRLYGTLGTRFGRVHRLAVSSTAEAIRALSALLPGFRSELMSSGERGVRYACFVGKNNIGRDELQMHGTGDIRIAPVLAGAKAGVMQTILGAVLVVVGIVVNIYSEGGASALGNGLIQAGVGMMIGGVIQMLSPQPVKTAADSTEEANYHFNGAINTTMQGNPVPLGYGRLIVGSAVVSAGILAEEQAYISQQDPRETVRHALDKFTQDYFG